MKRLTDKQIKKHIEQMNASIDSFNSWYDEFGSTPVLLEFPCGELYQSAKEFAGYVSVWQKQGKLTINQINNKRDRFSAQAIEGKVSVQTTLPAALFCWKELPQYRRQITL